MRFSIKTLGCKVNAYESAYYAETLKKRGHIQDDEQFDVCIINTCTVTNTAAAKSRQMGHRAKKQCPDAKTVVVGCYAETAKDKIDADLLIGAKGKGSLADQVEALFDKKEIEKKDTDGFEAMPVHAFDGRHRAFLKVQDGCNQYCAYCAIPYARGRERSLDADSAIQTAKDLANAGHKEIVLTGIHTGRYDDGQNSLTDLLRQLLEEIPHVTFRISSIEITEVTDGLLQLMKDQPRLQPHLHIPVQSGCTSVLERMDRPYTMEEFLQRLEEIRQILPEVSISTDVITGFVGETEAEHQETLENLEKARFSFLHVFPYSVREGTKAATMKPHLPGDVKKARVHDLVQLSEKLRRQDMARFETASVLVEQKKDGHYTGYTAQYHPVRIMTDRDLPARIQGKVRPENGFYIMEESDAVVETL